MNIDWFTLIAQVINFIVLMWLLKRYLYKPILKAIEERENKIVAELNDAEEKKKEARKEREEFQKKNEDFDLERDKRMEKIIEESNTEAQKLRSQARKEANSLKEKLEKEVRRDQEKRERDVIRRIQQEVVDISRKTLTDLSSISLEEQMVQYFLTKINGLNKTEKEKLLSMLASDAGRKPIIVQSAFKMSKKQQGKIVHAVNELLGSENKFQFIEEPKLISGIELLSNGYKLAWSVSEYLNSLEKTIILHSGDNAQTKS